MSSVYTRPATDSSSPSLAPRAQKSPIISSGRGGSGNKRPKSVLKIDQFDEAEILQKRRLEASLNPRVKIKYTGRGGTGNIRAASVAQSIPFDISADPDDEYEQIVLEGAQKAKKDKTPSTGRGGMGNFSRPRAKSFIAATVAPKAKKDKSRRRRSVSSSRFSTSTASTEHYELQRISTDTARLSLAIPGSPTTQSSSGRSSLPSSHSSSGRYSLPSRETASTSSAPSSPRRLTPQSGSSFSLLPVRPTAAAFSAPNSPLHSTAQSTTSLSSLPGRASTSSLGLLSPPASPTTPEASPILTAPRVSPSFAEPIRLFPVPHKLQKARSHDTTKWWKMGGRRRVKESVTPPDSIVPEDIAVPSLDITSAETAVSSRGVAPDGHVQDTMAYLEEVGMHSMEVRMRIREERHSIRNSQRHASPQEIDDNIEFIIEGDGRDLLVEPAGDDTQPLPSVPEEDGEEYVSFLDFS